MPRKAAGLTAAKVRTAGAGRYGDGAGLYLLVKPDGSRFWVARWVMHGRMREAGLGPAGGAAPVPLAEAREKARELRRALREGRDPIAEREAAKVAAKAAAQDQAVRGVTFRVAADLYIAAHEAGWRNQKHRAQWGATLAAYAYPHFGDMPVAQVATVHVMAALEPIWRGKPETASRVRGRIELVLDYAKARGWRTGENPARWRGHIANMLPKISKLQRVKHLAALPWGEIGDFMAELRDELGMAARALEFAILTAGRTGEVLGAKWGEMDLKAAVWTVPSERMKAARAHRVPLSDAALAVLRLLLPMQDAVAGDWVFHGTKRGKTLSNMAMLMLLRRMGRGDLTAHGFRSAFRDWTAETTVYAREVAEAALAHTVGDKVEAAYRRGDLFEKRRRLMGDWAAFCGRPMKGGAVEVERGTGLGAAIVPFNSEHI